jgi:hypothetical protein
LKRLSAASCPLPATLLLAPLQELLLRATRDTEDQGSTESFSAKNLEALSRFTNFPVFFNNTDAS